MNSLRWHDKMDFYKQAREEARFLETKILYGRCEMRARAECEMAEAIEKVGAWK